MSAPWWRTAANPSCADFCEGGHQPGEFSQGGGMGCTKTIAKTGEFTVEITQFVDAGDNPGTFERDPATIRFYESRNGYDLDVLTPSQAREFATALHVALFEAAHVAEQFNAKAHP